MMFVIKFTVRSNRGFYQSPPPMLENTPKRGCPKNLVYGLALQNLILGTSPMKQHTSSTHATRNSHDT